MDKSLDSALDAAGAKRVNRCSRQLRGWATANHAAYRGLLLALLCFLLNGWIELRWL
ncbi:MAG: hypothetical protein H0T45_00745 [Pyrinomonadaceae bacterium]|nr:hypothetical protein [Pyrinomonadaceae bacterium]